VAWCSLSIHHLKSEGKLRLLQAVRDATGTCLMIYEPTRLDGESREGYLQRFRRVNQPAWTMLTPEEWAQIDHHETTSDFPETAGAWLDLGRDAGFSPPAKYSPTRPAFTGCTATTGESVQRPAIRDSAAMIPRRGLARYHHPRNGDASRLLPRAPSRGVEREPFELRRIGFAHRGQRHNGGRKPAPRRFGIDHRATPL
jgi:hypothetical protein